jgi:CcmD family protein
MVYLVVAYAIVWAGLFAYLAFIGMRLRSVHTELLAVEELVKEREGRDHQSL